MRSIMYNLHRSFSSLILVVPTLRQTGIGFFHAVQRWPRPQGKATRLEAKDTKKSEAKAKDSPSEDRPSQDQGQKCSRPRTKNKSASALQKKGLQSFFQAISKKKSKKIFQAIYRKTRLLKNFSGAPQTFNTSKNTAVLEPRTGLFSRT